MIDVMCSYRLPGTDMVAVNVSPITYTLLSTLQQVYTPPPPHKKNYVTAGVLTAVLR